MFPELARDDVFRIETRRLWLRWPRMADAVAIARYSSLKEVAEMTSRIPHPYPKGAAEEYILASRTANAAGEALQLVMTPVARPNAVIGMVSVFTRGTQDLELGYALDPAEKGRGFATEAAQSMLDIVFGLTGVPLVRASVRLINPASRRVLEKCGFTFEGAGLSDAPARGGPMPVEFCRLDRSTWASLKGWREPRFERVEAALPEARCA